MGITGDTLMLYESGVNKAVTTVSAKAVSQLSKYSLNNIKPRYEDNLAIYHSKLKEKYFYPPQRLMVFLTQDDYEITVSEDTLTLTPTGWKKFGELEIGDVVWTNGIDKPQYQDKETLKRLYIDEGWTQGEIADFLGISKRTIRAYIHKFGLGKDENKAHYGVDNPSWKGDAVTKRGGYERTREKFNALKTGICSRCGRKLPTQLHHDDRNPVNIDENNLMELCDLCHAAEHHGMVIKWTRPARIVGIRYGGVDKTYGFALENGDNFIAGGFIIKSSPEGAEKIVDMRN